MNIKEKEKLFILKAKQIRSNRFIFQESEDSIQYEAVSTVRKYSKEGDLLYKTNEQIFNKLIITNFFDSQVAKSQKMFSNLLLLPSLIYSG